MRATATREQTFEEQLAAHEPHLVDPFRNALPHARTVVSGRLLAAAWREGLLEAPEGDTAWMPTGRGRRRVAVTRHAFGRIEPAEPVDIDPAYLLTALVATAPQAVRAELTDATTNLALALARRSTVERAPGGDMLQLTQGLPADEQSVAFERLATEGHNLHPCGRTRLGWRVDDLLAHDLESPVTSLGFLAVRRELHVGDDLAADVLGAAAVAEALRAARADPRRYVVTPVHPWQRRHVLRGRYADLAAAGALVPLDVQVPALVTAALRTLLVPGPEARYVKVSLDIQVTSTRRTISVASTRNGPELSRLLPDLIADNRVLLLSEPAGSAVVVPGLPVRDRDLAAIVRGGLTGRLSPGEVVVPGAALPALDPVAGRSVVAVLVDRFARTRGIADPALAALEFIRAYAELLLPPVLRLATRYGIGLEAHLQNCLPTFVEGVPHRLGLRDLAGMRIHAPRLVQALPESARPRLWPGSVTVTENVAVMRAKVGYTALQAHLGEVVLRLAGTHGLAEERAWAAIRSTVDEVYDPLGAQAREDHAWLTAPTVPHKALLRMRLRAAAGDSGDHYVDVANPLDHP